MNNTERDILLRIHTIITKIPAAADGGGSQSATMAGFVGFSEDMRTVLPYVQKAIMGLVTISNLKRYPEIRGEFEEGFDYHDPALVLAAIERWIARRIEQKWQDPDRYELDRIYKAIRAESGKQ